MEIEQTAQPSAPIVRNRPIVQLPAAEVDELDSSPNRGLNLKSLGRTIQRQALLIAGIATIVAVAASYQAMKIRPTYSGDFQLLVEPITNAARAADPSTVTRADGTVPGIDAFRLDYSTQIEILQSPSRLDQIVQEVKADFPQFTYDQLRRGLVVERLQPESAPEATRIIKVTYQDQDPALVQKVLQVTADSYLDYSLEQRTLYENLRNQLQLSPEEAIAASALSEDPSYAALRENLVTIETQLATELARFNEDSPVVRSLRERQRNATELLTQRAQQVIGQSLPGGSTSPQVQAYQNSIRLDLIGQLVTAGNQIRVLEARSRQISADRQSFQGRLNQFPAVARQYNDLTRQLEIATQTLNRLQTQRETLRVEAAQTEQPWQLVSAPLIPRDANGSPLAEPTRASNLVIAGAGLGLLLGTLLALLLERYRNVFYTVEDIQEAIKLPLVGVVPFSRGAKQSLDFPSFGPGGEIEDSRLETASFREAFSDLYSNIRLADPPIRSLMVCSAEPGDGKTTVALYLAQTAAGTGQRVLLVDTNLRLPQIHTRLDLRNTKGLSDLLASGTNPEELIQRSPLADNLFVLPAGSSMPGSARLLASDQMQQTMEKFQTMFDLVIYDTPHLFGLTDASFLTSQVDEVLMVIAANKTNRTAVDRVLNKLISLRAPGISIVANYLRENNSPSGSAYTRYNQSVAQARRDASLPE